MSTAVLSGNTSAHGRTVLEVVRDVATKIGLEQPSQLFGTDDRTSIELGEAVIEAADQIVREHDWQILKTLQTHVGDGVTTTYSQPTDYLRMPIDAQIWSTRWEHPLQHITPEKWLSLEVRDFDVTYGTWTIYGGNFVYRPALTSSESAKFWYISKNYAVGDDGQKARFDADGDRFLLDDRVLELFLLWVWREQKGLEYGEEMSKAQLAIAREISKDKGARIVTQSTSRRADSSAAYPLDIVP